MVGTDGLWDNCFNEEVLSVIKHCQREGMDAGKSAHVLAHYARYRAADPRHASPFAYGAHQAGLRFMGGKMDDITVIVAFVTASSPMVVAASKL